jgi:hypothetical protein
MPQIAKHIAVPNAQSHTVEARFIPDSFGVDIEQKAVDEAYLLNTTVHSLAWQGVTVTVKDRQTNKPKTILDNIDGIVHAGT